MSAATESRSVTSPISLTEVMRSRRSTPVATAVRPMMSGRKIWMNTSRGGASIMAARSGPARARFFGTISPSSMCSADTTVRATAIEIGMDQLVRQPQGFERSAQQGRNRRLAERAKAEGRESDSELARRDHQRKLFDGPQGRTGLAGRAEHRLQPVTAAGENRELGPDEESVRSDECDGQQQEGRQSPTRSFDVALRCGGGRRADRRRWGRARG